jgi:hypothetical protein
MNRPPQAQSASRFVKKSVQFLCVQFSIAADTRTNVEPEGSDFVHRLAHIIGLQSTGKKNGNRNLFTNPAAQSPRMPPSGAAQLLRGKHRIP